MLDNIIDIIRTNSSINSYKNILQKHPGGNQVYHVFECLFQGKKVAVKLYKPIATHLVVHTIAITYLLQKNSEFDQLIKNQTFNLSFPKTIAVGNPISMNFVPPISILVQEWVSDSETIHKIFPRDHVTIIHDLIKKLTLNKGFMLDIMSKNWLVTTKDTKITYVDLVLFNPTGRILEKIKYYSENLE